ncbi:hypothetical protein L1987_09549 [Smallanthus sonchifolius]|uniref:Uncharacterized protein n=1 Tax=Smallanthus sonchifolius TaxID=185202 RepID=A0ACB9JNQ4_9ASTR|nr:hypothetical protein L1987_09549 [Smallanthus sonchifolius]
MKDSSCRIRNDLINYIKKAESHYLEDTAAVESGKIDLDEVFQNCLQKAKLGSQQWNSVHESLVSLEKSNGASLDEIVR